MPEAGRVIGGSARGIRLAAPGPGTRPIADRVKESLFGALEADPSAPLDGVFLDLYAGSGAAGIEALSRGAPAALFVERDSGAARVIAANLERSGLAGGRVVRADALTWLAGEGAAAGAFRCVVADPPYADDRALERVLDVLGDPASRSRPPESSCASTTGAGRDRTCQAGSWASGHGGSARRRSRGIGWPTRDAHCGDAARASTRARSIPSRWATWTSSDAPPGPSTGSPSRS